MVPPAVSLNAVMYRSTFQFLLVLSMALMGHGGDPQGSSMVRREPVKAESAKAESAKADSVVESVVPMASLLRKEAAEEDHKQTISITAQGAQIKSDAADRKHRHEGEFSSSAHKDKKPTVEKQQKQEKPWHSDVLSEAASQDEVFEEEENVAPGYKPEKIEMPKKQEQSQGDAPKSTPKRLEIPGDNAAFVEETAGASAGMKLVKTTQVGQDEKNHNAAQLSAEEEELYYKFFPEEKPLNKEEASALEVGQKKSFKIKVPVAGVKKRLCLTEDNFNHKVRAEPCRKHSTRQKWYWMGSKLKNLHSRGHCLGLAHVKNAEKSESSVEGASLVDKIAETLQEAFSHTVSMEFKCSDNDQLLQWELDESGRLKSSSKSECLAINEKENFNAFVLPCGHPHHTR